MRDELKKKERKRKEKGGSKKQRTDPIEQGNVGQKGGGKKERKGKETQRNESSRVDRCSAYEVMDEMQISVAMQRVNSTWATYQRLLKPWSGLLLGDNEPWSVGSVSPFRCFLFLPLASLSPKLGFGLAFLLPVDVLGYGGGLDVLDEGLRESRSSLDERRPALARLDGEGGTSPVEEMEDVDDQASSLG